MYSAELQEENGECEEGVSEAVSGVQSITRLSGKSLHQSAFFTMARPGFPGGGAPTYYLPNFPEFCIKM